MNNIISRIPIFALIPSLLIGTACVTPTDEGGHGSLDAVDQHEATRSADVLWASVETIEAMGIVYWEPEAIDGTLIARGMSEQGDEIARITIREWTDGERSGKEIITSGGGLVRIDDEGEIIEAIHDPALFAAFARDTEDLRAGEATIAFRSCDFWEWLSCAGAVLEAVISCVTFDLKCASALLKSAKCLACFIKLFEDGKPPTNPCENSPDPCCGVTCVPSHTCNSEGTCVPDPTFEGCPNIPCPEFHSCHPGSGECIPW